MKRRDFLKYAGLVTAGTVFSKSLFAAESRPPNIILITVDDLGWTDVGCYGSTYHQTPNIDKLASQGMRFTDAYAACALCSPTRASIMTGRYPARIGITDWIRARYQGGDIPWNKVSPSGYEEHEGKPLMTPVNPLWMELSEITVAEVLKIGGYTNCHIGKWHLGATDWYPEKQGFDYNIGGCDMGEPPTFFDPWARAGNEVWKGEKAVYGIDTLRSRKKGEYLTDREADEAVDFIRKHKNDPFFLNLCHYAVHYPIQAKEDKIEKYENIEPTGPHKVAKYAAMVESVDDAVGRVLDTLDELDLADNTVVVFYSDNGGLVWPGVATSNAPLRKGKGTPYEGGIREPFIVRWPGKVKPETVSHEVITSVDILPTFLEMAGMPLPKGCVIDGVSIVEHLKSDAKKKLNREAIYWHYPHYRGGQKPYSIIRAGDWKLIKWYGPERFELYHLKDDISESNDLAGQKPDKVKALNGKLTTWLKDTNAKLPKPNPDYTPRGRK